MSDSLNSQQFDAARGQQFARLTQQGKLYYADRRTDGADHDTAFADARHSYGLTGKSGKS